MPTLATMQVSNDDLDRLLDGYEPHEKVLISLAAMATNLCSITRDLAEKVAPNTGLAEVFEGMVTSLGSAACTGVAVNHNISEERFDQLLVKADEMVGYMKAHADKVVAAQREQGNGTE